MKKANKSQTEFSKYFCARRFSGGHLWVNTNVALMVRGALSNMAWVKTKVIALVGILATSGVLLGIYGLQLSSEKIGDLRLEIKEDVEPSSASGIVKKLIGKPLQIAAPQAADCR